MHRRTSQTALFASALACTSATLSAQTFGPGSGGVIPDGQGDDESFTSTILVSGVAPGLSLDRVSLSIEHLWVGDIVAILTAPSGDDVHLLARLGATPAFILGDSSNLSLAAGPYVFRNTGASFLGAAVAAGGTLATVPGGTFAISTTPAGYDRPLPDLDGFGVFAGDDLNGLWTLTLQDWILPDPGMLANWSLTIVPAPGTGILLGLAVAIGGRGDPDAQAICRCDEFRMKET